MKRDGWALSIVLAASAVGALGEYMLLVVVNVLILNRTHSAPAVAVLWIIPQVAILATGTIIGRWTDRWDKRRTLWVSNALGGLLIIGLLFTTNVFLIYLIFGLFAVMDGTFRAAFNPYFRWMVPASHRVRANAVNGALNYGALIVGPALAGALLLGGHGEMGVGVVAAALLASAGLLLLAPTLRGTLGDAKSAPATLSWWSDLRGVVRFLRGHRIAAGVLLLFRLALVFGTTADTQEVVFAHRALHLGSSGYGLLVSVAGVGYAVGAIITWIVAKRVPAHWMVGIGSVGAALGYFGYAMAPGFLGAAVGLLGLGICQAAASTGFGAFIQGALPPEEMGRITSSVRSLFAGLTILTTAGGGFLVGNLGVRIWMIGATGAMVLVATMLAVQCLSRAGSAEFQRAAVS